MMSSTTRVASEDEYKYSTVNAVPWLMVCHLLVIEANMMSSRVPSAGTVNALPWRDVQLSIAVAR
jgi:hypothetical protein